MSTGHADGAGPGQVPGWPCPRIGKGPSTRARRGTLCAQTRRLPFRRGPTHVSRAGCAHVKSCAALCGAPAGAEYLHRLARDCGELLLITCPVLEAFAQQRLPQLCQPGEELAALLLVHKLAFWSHSVLRQRERQRHLQLRQQRQWDAPGGPGTLVDAGGDRGVQQERPQRQEQQQRQRGGLWATAMTAAEGRGGEAVAAASGRAAAAVAEQRVGEAGEAAAREEGVTASAVRGAEASVLAAVLCNLGRSVRPGSAQEGVLVELMSDAHEQHLRLVAALVQGPEVSAVGVTCAFCLTLAFLLGGIRRRRPRTMLLPLLGGPRLHLAHRSSARMRRRRRCCVLLPPPPLPPRSCCVPAPWAPTRRRCRRATSRRGAWPCWRWRARYG